MSAMPPLEEAPPLSPFEFWSPKLFYAPVWLWIAWLALRHRGLRLPLIANPGLPASGLVGESKSDVLSRFGPEAAAWTAPFVTIDRGDIAPDRLAEAVLATLEKAGLALPVVAKPDLGCRGAGVRPVRSRDDLIGYLGAFPIGHKLLLQRLIDVEGEAGIFYVRRPGATQGQIFSLTLKYFPRVTGDGRRTLRALIAEDPRAGLLPHLYLHRHAERLDAVVSKGKSVRLAFAGSHSRGAIFRNGNAYVTEALRARFDAIADAIPGFSFGRFDVRFADFEAFRQGCDFTILECNGAGAEATHIWDSRTRLSAAYKTLFRQFALLWQIGADNRARGHRPEPWRVFLRRWLDERRLVALYPPTA
jgi:hypothetical protein